MLRISAFFACPGAQHRAVNGVSPYRQQFGIGEGDGFHIDPKVGPHAGQVYGGIRRQRDGQGMGIGDLGLFLGHNIPGNGIFRL